MTDDTFLIRSSDALVRTFADEVLLASASGGNVDRLEGSAAAVWDLLEEPRSLPDLVAALARAYETPTDRILRDVEPLVRDLVERGWIYEVQDTDD